MQCHDIYREHWITAAWTLMQPSVGQLTRRRFIMSEKLILHSCCALCFWLDIVELKGHVWEMSPESTVKMAAKALSFRPSMTLPKWQTSMDMRMPPVASRRMYRHSATMHSHSTPAEKTSRVRKRHARVMEAEDRLGWMEGGGECPGRDGEERRGLGSRKTWVSKDEWRGMKRKARRARCWWTTEPAADLHSLGEDKLYDKRWSASRDWAQRCMMTHNILRFKCKLRCNYS